MGSVFQRKGSAVWYMTYWDAVAHKWVQHSTGERSKKVAERVLRDMEGMQFRRAVAAGVDPGPLSRGKVQRRRTGGKKHLLVAEAVEGWIEYRAEAEKANHDNEVAHLHNHFLPDFGTRPLRDVRPKDIQRWVRSFHTKQPAAGKGPTAGHVPQHKRRLAPRTIRKIYGTVRKMFNDFVADELIPKSPCIIKEEDLPPDIDRDPEWRDSAIYTADEVEALISDPRIPEHRRFYYAISFLAGVRHGEIAGLYMRNVVADEPLQKLLVPFSYGGRTKTDATRKVPIHPVLAAMIAEWKLGGFERWAGRRWTPDDYLLPGKDPRSRKVVRGDPTRRYSRHVAYHALVNDGGDLDTLGFRHRRIHDARRTFISLGRKGGADKDVLKDITHAPSKQVFDMYTSYDWETKCEAVLCIKVGRRRGGRTVGTGHGPQ